MFTTSFTNGNFIIYDFNLAFAYVFLAPRLASSTLGVSLAFPSTATNKNDPGAVYYTYFDITPTVA